MELQKADLQEQLQHEQKMLKIRRRNLRTLEEQEANYGLAVPMEIGNQIAQIKEYIRDHEKRIDELQIIMSEGDEPISEVEYCMHLAEVWYVAEVYPKIAHLYRLDFTRLRLHITPERARELELEIKHSLALELDIDSRRNFEFRRSFFKMVKWMCGEGTLGEGLNVRLSDELLPFWKMLSLDPKIATERLRRELDFYMKKLKIHRVHHLLIGQSYFHNFITEEDKEYLSELITEYLGPDDTKALKEEIEAELDALFLEEPMSEYLRMLLIDNFSV